MVASWYKAECRFMAGTGFPRGSQQADLGRRGHLAEGQVPGAAAYSRWRPQAGIQQWPVWGGLIRRVAVDSGAGLPMYRCPNFGGELKIIAAILEQPVI